MYFYGYGQHQPHAFVNKLNYNNKLAWIYSVYELPVQISQLSCMQVYMKTIVSNLFTK